MAVRAVSHVAIGVRDVDRALEFYRDFLGPRVSADRIEEFPQGHGQPPARRRGVYLRWVDGPHATYIVLDQQLTNETVGAPARLFQAGIHHFAFWVDDLDAMLARARDAGFEVAMGAGGPAVDAEWSGEPRGSGLVRSVVLRDPEGNHVQLDQRV